MRAYSREEETKVRLQGDVRAWGRAGLIDAAQQTVLARDLRTDLRRTNIALRLVLAIFTALIVAASVALTIVAMGLRWSGMPFVTVVVAAAIVCVALAEWLVARWRLYRHGVEEALAASSVLLLSIATMELVSLDRATSVMTTTAIAGLIVGAAGGWAIFQRFGMVYAAVVAVACAALVPFQLAWNEWLRRSAAGVILAVVFGLGRAARARQRDENRQDEHAVVQAAAFLGLYAVLNLRLLDPEGSAIVSERWFYWGTYALTWLLPAACLALGIREKDRPLIAVGLLTAIATLVTNKAYLQWPRHAWDPMILGVVLAGSALAVRRWLDGGVDRQRRGFTAVNLLDSDRDLR